MTARGWDPLASLNEAIEQNGGTCRGCRAEIVWAINPSSGKAAPLERAKHVNAAAGSFALELVAGVLCYHSSAGKGDRWVSHFATCPDAQRFRRVEVKGYTRRAPRRDADTPEEPRPAEEGTARARHTDPATSHTAAASVTAAAQRDTRARVLLILGAAARTDEELIAEWRRRWPDDPTAESGIRSRRSELVADELVRDSTTTRPSRRGRPSTVWEAV